jgi:hypothetical protein
MTLETKTDCVEFLRKLSIAEKEAFPEYAELIFDLSELLKKAPLTEESSINDIKDLLLKEIAEEISRSSLDYHDLASAKCIASNISEFEK